MKRLVIYLALPLFLVSVDANARSLADLVSSAVGPNPDSIQICYLFKNDNLIKKDVCIESSAEFTGASSTYLQLTDGKGYEITRVSGDDDSKFDIDGRSAQLYHRNASGYEVTSYEQLMNYGQEPLYCFKNKVVDICYN